MRQRVILHADLDYFYAQCEENSNPTIRGKPVVVCVFSGRTPDSGVVSTSSYEARKYGVKAGIPIVRAKKLLESTDAVFLPMNRSLYESVSDRIMDTLQSQCDVFEKGGIDEAFLDVTTTTQGSYDKARTFAINLKQLLFDQEHVTCSIGVAPNKLVAKIASDHVKPNGLTVIEPEQLHSFLEGPVNRIPGVGRKVEARLQQLHVSTVDELNHLSPVILNEAFGKSLGSYLFRAARGDDNEPVRSREHPTQLSRIGTLKQNTRDLVEVDALLEDLARSVAEKLAEAALTCKSVSIIAILDDLTMHTKSTTLDSVTKDPGLISEASKCLMREFLESMPEAVLRRIGVKVSGIITPSGQRNLSEFLSN